MTRTLVVLLLIASASGAGAIDANRFLQLDTELLACFDQQAVRLDDGRSDARSVAAGVFAACGPAKMKLLSEMGFSSQEAVAKAYRDGRDQDVDRATIAVLKARVGKR
ncbi:hypothetical protein [Bradyrhizobium sp. 76]|uniref:hypothetical protein n=1 Tax=Bradyrhizobium sp. 76 TaxID=2782680 RepID=UPI001FFA48FD|nr:hypothetical protein [Bradyrhizobium sp. 76]MCK1407645.1 hypothetical protein [Bradyrhizobium sp. 76]